MYKRMLVYASCSLLIFCCSNSEDSQRKSATGSEKTLSLKSLELLNCDNDLCRISGSEDSQLSVDNTSSMYYQIKGLFILDSSIITISDIDKVPAFNFSIDGIPSSLIQSVSYYYEKTDNQGNRLEKTEYRKLDISDGKYRISINVNSLSSGILNASPFDKHYINLRVIDSDNVKHFASIMFNMSCNIPNPLLITRDNVRVQKSDYYLFKSSEKYLIDSLIIENLLPYDTNNDLFISITNSTKATVVLNEAVQRQSVLGECINSLVSPAINLRAYKYDIYNSQRFIKSQTSPTYALSLYRDFTNKEEEGIPLPFLISDGNIYIKNIPLTAKTKIRIDVYAKFINSNKSIGGLPDKIFYSGYSFCGETSVIALDNCDCFYMYYGLFEKIKSENTFSCGRAYGTDLPTMTTIIGQSVSDAIKPQYKPSCTHSLITESLTAFKANTESVQGRSNTSITRIEADTYLQNLTDAGVLASTYAEMDTLSTSTGTMDTDETKTTYVNSFLEYNTCDSKLVACTTL